MAQNPQRSAGWTRGVSRKSIVNLLPEFGSAVGQLAKLLNVSKGVVVERALLAFMESMPDGAGAAALETVAEVRQHAETERKRRCTAITKVGTQCINKALPGGDRCGHHPRERSKP